MDSIDPLISVLGLPILAAGNAAAPITVNVPTIGSIIAIVVALIGLFLSSFNSGAEIAFFSLTKEDVEGIENDTVRERIQNLLKTPERLLGTTL